MARTESTMLELGTAAPEFSLPNMNPEFGGDQITLAKLGTAPALLVAFICNHCPYVVHLVEGLAQYANDYQPQGLQCVAISSNSVESHPQDGPDAMRVFAGESKFKFAYCYDQDQSVAKAYQAACTPDFFLFNANRVLVYRGQFDQARPRNEVAITGADLRAATDAVLSGNTVSDQQVASIGCNIKWYPGNEPDYFAS